MNDGTLLSMRSVVITVICAAGVAACRGQRSAREAAPLARAPRSVFSDSALHVKLCESVKPGEDWRRVCVPKDQSARVP